MSKNLNSKYIYVHKHFVFKEKRDLINDNDKVSRLR